MTTEAPVWPSEDVRRELEIIALESAADSLADPYPEAVFPRAWGERTPDAAHYFVAGVRTAEELLRGRAAELRDKQSLHREGKS